MAWAVSIDPVLFEEAVTWFRRRVPLPKDEWEKMSIRAQRKAFTVAAVADMDLLEDTKRSLDAAMSEGHSFEEWRDGIGDRLRAAWSTAFKKQRPKNPGALLETIFRTNVQQSYSAGRYRQLTSPAVLAARPFWMYDAVLDDRTTGGCRELNGAVLPATDPFWDTHTPPLHFRCRSGLRSLREDQARERGVATAPPENDAQEGFGQPPMASDWRPLPSRWRNEPKAWAAYLEAEAYLDRRPQGPEWGAGHAEHAERTNKVPPWFMQRLGMAGTLDESQGKLLSHELGPAAVLVAEGNSVTALAVSTEHKVRNPDTTTNGVVVEFKELTGKFDRIKERVEDSLKDKYGNVRPQARHIVIDARNSVVTSADFPRILHKVGKIGAVQAGHLDFLRLIGKDFDVTWTFPLPST